MMTILIKKQTGNVSLFGMESREWGEDNEFDIR